MLPTDDRVVSTVTTRNAAGLQRAGFTPSNPASYINPAPDPRLNDIVSRTAPTLAQGIIQQTDAAVGGDQKFPFACRFMFNPAVVTVGYQMAENITPPEGQTDAQAAGAAVYPGSTSISFSLLFDRTYDVYYGPHGKGAPDLRNLGCYVDVAALEQVTGARVPFGETAPIFQGMVQKGVYVIFGGGRGGGGQKGITGLTFAGFITSMTVNYGLFSTRMVPTRCAVDITVQQMAGENPYDYKAKGGTLLERYASLRTTTSSRALSDKRNTIGSR